MGMSTHIKVFILNIFPNKEKALKPKSGFDYFMLGMLHGMELKKKIGKPPVHTPSKIIHKSN